MRISDLRERLQSLGALPKHQHRVLRLWSNALPQTAGKRQIEHFLPATLRAALPALEAELAGLAQLESAHPGDDGSERLLVKLGDGQLVESVLRHNPSDPASSPRLERFEIEEADGMTLFMALMEIRERLDPSLQFDFVCRAGICGSCKQTLVSGEVDHPDAPAISAAERAEGKILTCCAVPLTDLVIGPR